MPTTPRPKNLKGRGTTLTFELHKSELVRLMIKHSEINVRYIPSRFAQPHVAAVPLPARSVEQGLYLGDPSTFTVVRDPEPICFVPGSEIGQQEQERVDVQSEDWKEQGTS